MGNDGSAEREHQERMAARQQEHDMEMAKQKANAEKQKADADRDARKAEAEASERARKAEAEAKERAIKAKADADRDARKAEAAAKAEIEKAKIAEQKRADELAKAALRAAAKEKEEADKRQKAQEKAIQKMKDEDAEKARLAKEREDKRRIAHENNIKKMEAERKREEEEYKKKMRDMVIKAKQDEVKDKKQQRDNAIKQMEGSIKVANDQIKLDQTELKEVEEKHKTAEEELANLNNKIKAFKQKPKKGKYKDSVDVANQDDNGGDGEEKDKENADTANPDEVKADKADEDNPTDTSDPSDKKEEDTKEEDYLDDGEEDYVDPKYVKAKNDMLRALRVFQRDDDEIWSAIEKTGQREDGVGRFLKLTHALIGETMASQDNANKLDAELHTFSTLIERECQDNITIDHLFRNLYKLERFIPILAKQEYTECQELVCDKEEFNEEILQPIQLEINKEIKEWKKRNPNEGDVFDVFLEKYKLGKFKQGLEDAGLDELEGIADLESDEEIDALIEEAGITGLFKKKFKRAINDYKTGKYKPADPSEKKDDQDDQKRADPFDTFLKHYKLSKYKDALKELDIDSLDAVRDPDLDDETIAEMIEEAGITGLAKKKFKTAIKDVQGNKYKPPKVEESKEESKSDEKPKPVSAKETRLLKRICTKPDTWQKYQKEKADLTKKALVYTSPVLGGFFMRMNTVVKEAQKLLSYSPQKNDQQNKAMEILMESVKSPKAIEAPKSSADDDNKAPDEANDKQQDEQKAANPTDDDDPEKLPDFPQRKGWKQASEVQVYSKTDDRWYNGKIKDITKDDQGEWLNIEYVTPQHKKEKQVNRYGPDIRDPVNVECRAIAAAIDVDINVTQVMMARFELNDTTLRVLPVAQGVEESTKAILQCQSQIRGSVKLAGSILKLKPANLTEIAEPLWNAVDDGILHIIEGALEMSKISAQYFGFFLRFNQSFQRFVSMNQENKEVSLFTSLEHVKQDIREFSAFKKEFNTKVEKLSAQAMQVIKNCVTTHIGVEQFESTRAAREESERDYLDKKAKYDVEKLRLDLALETLRDKRAKDKGREAALKMRVEQLKQRTAINETFKDKWLKEIDDLRKQNFDAGGAIDTLVNAEAANVKQ